MDAPASNSVVATRRAHFLALAAKHRERAAQTFNVVKAEGHLKLADGYEATAATLQELGSRPPQD